MVQALPDLLIIVFVSSPTTQSLLFAAFFVFFYIAIVYFYMVLFCLLNTRVFNIVCIVFCIILSRILIISSLYHEQGLQMQILPLFSLCCCKFVSLRNSYYIFSQHTLTVIIIIQFCQTNLNYCCYNILTLSPM